MRESERWYISAKAQLMCDRLDSDDVLERHMARRYLRMNMPVLTNGLETNTRNDGGPGSGNWGHEGRKGKVGGSGKGGGVANRLSTPDGGFTSRSQAENENRKRDKERKAKSGGSGGSGRHAVEGKDISKSYSGDGSIKDVIHAQGFDGLPRVVGKDEFDKAVAESGFIAQRSYTASSKEILEAYQDALYNGEWYVECTTGGAQYGQGMYCAADYNGELTDGIKAEMDHYTALGQSRNPITESDVARLAQEKGSDSTKAFNDAFEKSLEGLNEQEKFAARVFHGYDEPNDADLEKAEEYYYGLSKAEKSALDLAGRKAREAANGARDEILNMSAEEYAAMKGVGPATAVETLTLDPSAKVVDFNTINQMRTTAADDYAKEKLSALATSKDEGCAAFIRCWGGFKEKGDYPKSRKWEMEHPDEAEATEAYILQVKNEAERLNLMDIGAFAAMKGYDAINAGGHGQSGSYTVILNRSKVLFLNDAKRTDAEDDEPITFRIGKDGKIEAIRNGKVIGWVIASDGPADDSN